MLDYILFGLVSGLIVFFSLFLVSFITLGLITGFIRLIAFVLRELGLESPAYQEQTA